MAYETHRPTDVSVVLAWLIAFDDFATKAMIRQATGLPDNRVRPALAHLKLHFAIDCMVVNDVLWFFATPASDDRTLIKKQSPNGVTRTEKGRASRKHKAQEGQP